MERQRYLRESSLAAWCTRCAESGHTVEEIESAMIAALNAPSVPSVTDDTFLSLRLYDGSSWRDNRYVDDAPDPVLLPFCVDATAG